MMLENYKNIYFLGIGGIGMSALARYFNMLGHNVLGYDKTNTTLTTALENEGISIHYSDRGSEAIMDIDLVVYTPAIPSNLQEYIAFKNSGIRMAKRAEILGEITKDYFTIAIAGTHGKTTITSMVAHFLNDSGVAVNAFIGGIASNYNSNLILNKEAKIMVVEADEFDRSFLHISPDIAIISSMDADHLDIYKNKNSLKESFFEFANNIKSGGTLLLNEGLEKPHNFNIKTDYYGEEETNMYQLIPKGISNGKQIFSTSFYDNEFEISMPGRHNLLNASAAISVAKILQIDSTKLKKAIASYAGVKRRFELIANCKDHILIDDYAHHPTEIRAAISATREMYAGKEIMGIFQPHLYTRTRDFADDFAKELSKLDKLVLLDIYPAREKPIEGINSQMLLDKVKLKDKQIVRKEDLSKYISQNSSEITLIMGAGDINKLVTKISETLCN
ncbi:MAG: UDP-N-acetylmuramate--L-alanine ligase [Bacteroidales bacterium]|nr:UDP-N-acetylmuramate--L-alanine ligase [Bacteroidales bacterium]